MQNNIIIFKYNYVNDKKGGTVLTNSNTSSVYVNETPKKLFKNAFFITKRQ